MDNIKVPERLPYAILTRLVELLGWKRFEMNHPPKFTAVSETNVICLTYP